MQNLPAVITAYRYLDAVHVEKAVWEDETKPLGAVRIAGYVTLLATFGCCGVEKYKTYRDVKDYLFRRGIVHSSNDRGIVWLPELSGGLRALFGE